MNRNLVKRNLRTTILAGGIAAAVFATAFIVVFAWVG